MRLILFLLSFVIHADLSNNIDIHKEKYEKLALEIWSLAEMGYLETKSSKLLQDILMNQVSKLKVELLIYLQRLLPNTTMVVQ